ncbi:16995_t:CDS:2 [Dentiscutata erythropus]|uniref:16995_t:CDS:1 n=1 Tax=Dentiscutata erythropus TaxID=1348616 RepID=A0A9N9N435_9GLOM|nr:16995_t:CDS:2 [Dentiscutata erythropus]
MRGQATYSTFSPRDQIKSKNDNALIIDISQLLISHGGRVISTKIAYKNHLFQVTNVYAPQNSKDRSEFFERWTPLYDEESINILGETLTPI